MEVTWRVALFTPMNGVISRGKHMSTTSESIESASTRAETALVETLSEELERVESWLTPHFRRPETRRNVGDLLRALLGRVEHKNSWGLSEEARRPTPYAFQYLLGRARWNPDEVRDSMRAEIARKLGTQGNLILDETGFLKKGRMSAGVACQYTGTAGGIANCQIGVFLIHATSQGHTFLDGELYLPEEWTQDRARCRQAGIPDEVDFSTKPALARRMLQRAFAAGYAPRWVLGDEVYGRDGKLRDFLERRRQRYALTVASNTPLERGLRKTTPAEVLAGELRPEDFQRLSAGDGAKGPRESDWARVRLNPGLGRSLREPGQESLHHWLLVRRDVDVALEELTLSNHDFFLVHAPDNTSWADMVEAAGGRWPVESCFESAKQEVGLDEYEVRSWTGWYRHMTLCLVAHSFLTTARLELNALQDDASVPLHSSRPSTLATAPVDPERTPAPSCQPVPIGRPRHQEGGGQLASPGALLPKVLGPPCKTRSTMLAFLRRRGLRSRGLASNSSASACKR
jgi:SRSO17 transposase